MNWLPPRLIVSVIDWLAGGLTAGQGVSVVIAFWRDLATYGAALGPGKHAATANTPADMALVFLWMLAVVWCGLRTAYSAFGRID